MSNEKSIVVTTPPTYPKLSLSIALVSGLLAMGSIAFTAYHISSFTSKIATLKSTQSQTAIADAAQQSQQIQTLEKRIQQFELESSTSYNQKTNEIAYLIHLANWQLTLQANPALALKTLLLAQQQLNTIQNPDLLSLKNALSADAASLQNFAAVPVDSIFGQIKAINDAILKLSPIAAPITQKSAVIEKNIKDSSKAKVKIQEYLHDIGEKIESLFVVRHLNKPSTPLLTPILEMTLKQNITAQLNMAEWALLHHNQTVFATALQTVSDWMSQYFTAEPGSDAILTQLNALQKITINPTLPTLDNSLTALANTHLHSPQPTTNVKSDISTPIKTISPETNNLNNSATNTIPEKNNPEHNDQKNTKPIKTNSVNSAPVET